MDGLPVVLLDINSLPNSVIELYVWRDIAAPTDLVYNVKKLPEKIRVLKTSYKMIFDEKCIIPPSLIM